MCVCSRHRRNNHSSGRCAAAPTPSRALRSWVSGPVSGRTTSDSVSSTGLPHPPVSALPPHLPKTRAQQLLPFSISRFCLNHRHRRTSSSDTTLLTSSSPASRPSLTHCGSGHPTCATSPSAMNSRHPSSRHGRQKTCAQDSAMQRAPLTEERHTRQLYAVWLKRDCSVRVS